MRTAINFVDPVSGEAVATSGDRLVTKSGASFPVTAGVPRFCDIDNYTTSFGRQWNLFEKTQIDGQDVDHLSALRLFEETGWQASELDGLDILEVGSGAGRFSRAILQHSRANLYSIDYSNAVEANLRNNGNIGAGRFWLAQASIYEMPFPDDSFDKVLCIGVLQHTPNFEQSIAALVRKAKPGAEIVVDFYPIRGWWTKVHAKYLFRPWTKRMDHDRLLGLIDRHVDRLIPLSDKMHSLGMGALTRFLPLVDQGTLPPGLTPAQRREWSVLDTFDQYSPEHDHPQRIAAVAAMFERHGAKVSFAGQVKSGTGNAAVVRAVRNT